MEEDHGGHLNPIGTRLSPCSHLACQLEEVFHMTNGHAATFGYPRRILNELLSV
jgi:hypothetical protein